MSGTGREQILSYISDESQKSINELFKRAIKGMEFEFIFMSKKSHQMNKERYVLLLKYMKKLAKDKKIVVTQPERSLDISYNSYSDKLDIDDNAIEDINNSNSIENAVYRVTADGTESINKLLSRLNDIQNKNYLIYKFLLHTLRKDNANYKLNFMLKSRNKNDNIDIDDLNMRIRLSKEEDLMKQILKGKIEDEKLNNLLISSPSIDTQIRQSLNKRIIFRLKERTSLYIVDDDTYFIRIDLTDTKTSKDIRYINDTSSNYELEIEYGLKGSGVPKKEHLDKIYEISESLLKFTQQSSFIMGNSMSEKVIQYYKEINNIEGNINNLVARQPVSLEIQHVTEILPNRYAVSDKADGDRYSLVIYQNCVYLINTNLTVKDTGIVLDKKLSKYNGTNMDGEYIYIPSEKRHVYMVFDCMRNGSNDLKQVNSFMERLDNADKIIQDCFILKGQTGFIFKEVPKQDSFVNTNNVSKFYGTELTRFYDVLSKDIKIIPEYPLIRRKFFMPVFGAERWEIFKYSVEFWTKYSSDAKTKFPYLLDGLIYHPLEQAYVTNVTESKYHEYKWKPPTKNSMDFYIEFKKDPQTGKILNVFDNSLTSENVDGSGEIGFVRNKTYKICTLYVGKSIEGRETPVPFEQNYGISDAYIYQRDGEIRDLSGDILTDKTVVEFYYQNDPTILPQQRWIPIRTRYDKTESVERYNRRYGNYSATAERIWRSIINPILMEDFTELALGNTDKRNFYDIKIKELNSKISHKLIVAVNKENKYYQKVSKLASTMRQYHNFIKSNLIYTYCNKMYQDNQQQSVLDIGCGRGGDIGKFYYTEVAYLVGIDIDAEGFKSPVDGAISRYNAFRRKKPNFPKMYFIQADARALFDYDSQVKSLSGMDDVNKKLLQKFFPNVTEGVKRILFDRINCQFAMHYFLKDNICWNNFKENLKNHLRAGGYFITTTFDAREVMKALGIKDTYTVYYNDSDGNKKKFFEILKKFDVTDNDDLIGPGSAIDVHMSWAFDEGNYQTEFLVDHDFIKRDLERDADLELIDTDLFSNQLLIHKSFLLDATRFESSSETRDYMSNVAEYFDNSEMNRKCIEYTNLHRYFVFRKKAQSDISSSNKNIKKNQKGGSNRLSKINSDIQETYNFSDINKFKIPNMSNYDHDYSLINSIHKILVSHSIFPKSTGVQDFFKDMGLKSIPDFDVTNDYLHNITQKSIINHEINDNGKNNIHNIINGLSIFFVERDCNNFYDISYSTKKEYANNDKAIILMKESDHYVPIMKKGDQGIKGIMRMDDPLIQDLIINGEQL